LGLRRKFSSALGFREKVSLTLGSKHSGYYSSAKVSEVESNS
jgi:hypothetical protein